MTCVIDRIDATGVAAVEPVFRSSEGKIVIDLRRVTVATPSGVARLAHLVRTAQRRSVAVEIVSANALARQALVAAGLQHLVPVSD